MEPCWQALRRDPTLTSVHSDFFTLETLVHMGTQRVLILSTVMFLCHRRLGGTSLKAAALLSALRAQVPEADSFGKNSARKQESFSPRDEAVALQFDELYAHPDVASLAQVLSGSRQVRKDRRGNFQWIRDRFCQEILLGPAPVEGLLPASLGQEHMPLGTQRLPNSSF